jgi:hypothetical protein
MNGEREEGNVLGKELICMRDIIFLFSAFIMYLMSRIRGRQYVMEGRTMGDRWESNVDGEVGTWCHSLVVKYLRVVV